MIQNACNLRYEDAYKSRICHVKCTKEIYIYATKELPNTNSRMRNMCGLRNGGWSLLGVMSD
jgi:hypothetical protein